MPQTCDQPVCYDDSDLGQYRLAARMRTVGALAVAITDGVLQLDENSGINCPSAVNDCKTRTRIVRLTTHGKEITQGSSWKGRSKQQETLQEECF